MPAERALLQIAGTLQTLQIMVRLKESENWQQGLENRAQLAKGLQALKGCLPSMIQEIKRARLNAEGEGRKDAVALFGSGEEVLRSLGIAAYAAESSWVLADPKDEPFDARWEHYADQALRTLESHMPTLEKEAKCRFIAAAFRDITGELVSESAVSRALERGNIVKWGNLKPRLS